MFSPDLLPAFVDNAGKMSLKQSIEVALLLFHLAVAYLLLSTHHRTIPESGRENLSAASLVIAISGICFASFRTSTI